MKPWIIKAGGELLSNDSHRQKILDDLATWTEKHPVVFVHGGGPQIGRALQAHKIPVRFHNGRRITSIKAMKIVEKVLSGTINKSLVSDMAKRGVQSVGLSGRQGGILIGRPVNGLGRAGKPKKVEPHLLFTILEGGHSPILSTVASDSKGNAININADDAASALAVAMKAGRLIFLTDTPGVLNKNKKKISQLSMKKIKSLIKKGIIAGGMIPKVEAASRALKKGVLEVDILNGKKGINFASGTRIKK